MSDTVSRRSFLQTAQVASGVGLASSIAITGSVAASVASTAPAPQAKAKSVVVAEDDQNIVETQYGKVRGSERNQIQIFRGIPYAANTGGRNRFLPAKAPETWGGVRSALWYEDVCFTGPRTGWKHDENTYLFQWDDGQGSEDCMRVNVWTPRADNKKRPVMVWVHGGGYTSGSGQELRAYDGEKLAAKGDLVLVTFNHRLNVFGFLDVSDMGDEFSGSGNVGITDIVFLLQWVRDNIANFGGDPSNVTIMGQSGGGLKVTNLLAMPSAQGLFHKASIHSGSTLRIADKETAQRTSAAVLAELQITKSNWHKIYSIQTAELYDASVKALAKANLHLPARSPGVPPPPGTVRLGFGPHVDGTLIPHQPFDPDAPPESKNIPLLVGTVLNEFNTAMDKPDAFSMTEAELRAQVAKTHGDKADVIIAAFKNGHPKANPFQLSSIIAASGGPRANAVTQAQRKAAAGGAPAYLFWMQWQTPILDGRPMAFHCADLSFFFNNMERCETMTGTGPEARKLYDQMSSVWIAFAKTGNPNHPGIPAWKPVTAEGAETMIFDAPCRFSIDSDAAERKALKA
jgi:para-nitrobenzyl esterase